MDLLQQQVEHLQSIIKKCESKLAIMREVLNSDVYARDSKGDTTLHLVLRNLKTTAEIIGRLLDNRAPVNSANDSGLTPLHYAAKYKNCNVAILKLLLQRGADVHKMDKWGLTPLYYAIINDYCSLNAIELLLENGADIQFVDKSGFTLLHLAVGIYKVSIEVIKLLIDRGVDTHALNIYGESVIHLAVRYNRKEALELLLNQPGVKVNLSDNKQCTPLHRALYSSPSDPDIVGMLLKAGANVKKRTKNGQQSLHLAAYICETTVIQLLLENGALVNALDKNGQTPLSLAVKHCENENRDSLKLLLDAGALVFPDHPMRKFYPSRENPFDLVSPLHVAVKAYNSNEQSEISLRRVQLLLKYALLERPDLCFKSLRVDALTSNLGHKYLREIHSTCPDGVTTLGQFIVRSRLQEDDDDCHTDEVLGILATKAHPLYREVISGLLEREVLEEKFKEQTVYAVRKEQPRLLKRISLNYDSLCKVMYYLSDGELLNLMLAFYQPKDIRSSAMEFVTPIDKSFHAIQFEAERFFKRARLS